MRPAQIIGCVGLALGVALLILAWQGTTAPIDQLTKAATGRYSPTTLWYFLGGLALALAGGLSLVLPRRAA